MKFRDFHKRTGIECILEPREILDMAAAPFKEYPRFPRVPLLRPQSSDTSFDDVLEKRTSALVFEKDASLGLQGLGDVLHAGAGLGTRARGNEKPRNHPSAGALYPLEYYVAPYRVEGLKSHFYHYSPFSHALEEMIASPDVPTLSEIWDDPVPDLDPAAVIIITALWGRSYPKYGEFAYRLALLEAGHSAQDMLLAAAAYDIKARPVGSLRQDNVARLLDLTKENEDPLYLILLGA